MRLPFPERISVPAALLGATILFGLQQLQKTPLTFSIYSFLFIMIATIAFNAAGGFARPSGSYVFFYAVLGLIVGIVYKAYLGEPADSNLRAPILTMQVFCGGITGMLIAVLISRKLSRKKALLGDILKKKNMRNAAIGCYALGVSLTFISAVVPHHDGTILSAVMQLNRFLQVSVILSTIHAIRSSNGKSAINGLVILTVSTTLFFGVLGFGKEAMFIPFLCWVVTACSLRLKVRLYQVGLALLMFFLMSRFLVPYSQLGRDLVPKEATFPERIALSVSLLSDLGSVRQRYLAEVASTEIEDNQISLAYYNEPQGLFDRLTMIGPDDALISYTSQGSYTGLGVLPGDFANWIPHFLWPDKPPVLNGNALAHKVGGILGDDDLSTGISFTPSGEAYQLGGWVGIFIAAPLIWIMVFVVFDSLCGDVRESPWGLLCIAIFAHVAPEGLLSGAIYITWFGAIGIIFAAVTSAYAMPLIGTLVAGPEATGLVRLRRTTPLPAPLRKRNGSSSVPPSDASTLPV
ncbi:hypothetical protein BH10ACI4_BH10ACI4_32210 [soil metagenome]